jgi:hypothetical protein
MRKVVIFSAVAISMVITSSLSSAEEKAMSKMGHAKAELSDAQYTQKALSAAPAGIAKDAGVSREDKGGGMKTLRESKNGFTCMVALGSPMCADENSMAFFGAWMKHQNPPDKNGIVYMLRGDQGASNTDPYAMKKTADNHWVVTGSHIMLVGPAAKSMGLPDSADADPTKPSLMWANTPYAHAMIPVGGGAAGEKSAMESAEKK